MNRYCSFLLVLVALALLAKAAFGIDPETNGVFRIRTPEQAQGTAFVLEQVGDKTYLGTAAHVVLRDNGNMFTGAAYTLENDTIKDMPNAKVVAVDTKADLAVLLCSTKRQFKPLPLGSVERNSKVDKVGFAYRPSGLQIDFFGYASGAWLKTSGIVSFAYENSVYSDSVVAPGQSGGPVVLNDEIVGVVSGGSAWHTAAEDPERNVTWPARAGSARRLKEILDWAKTRE